MCLCYSCFWWKHMLIYLFTEKRGMGKGHQLTSQHGRQYGSQFACSSTCYLLKASRRSARSAARPVSPPARPTLLLTHRASTATSHTLLCTFQRSITTNMFSLGKPSQNPGLKTAPKATWMTRVENKQNRSTCC